MKLFIPEIGTEFILTKDWLFKLILEKRNNKLIKRFYPNYYNESYSYYSYVIADILEFKGQVLQSNILHALINNIPYRSDMTKDGRTQFKLDLYNLWMDNPTEWIAEEKLDAICLPVGTVLKVDRIYIRKGKDMSNYSSISFYAQLPGDKSKIRFFAKLDDVNTIECELKL
jgi:hypothetical protein